MGKSKDDSKAKTHKKHKKVKFDGNEKMKKIKATYLSGVVKSKTLTPAISVSNDTKPQIVKFQTDPSLKKNIKFNFVTEKGAPGVRGKTFLVGRDDVNSYTQKSQNTAKTSDKQYNKLLIGKYNKKTNELELFEVGGTIQLNSHVTNYRSSMVANLNGTGEMSYIEQRAQLFEAFGSTNKRKQLKALAANQVKIDSNTAAVMQSAIKSAPTAKIQRDRSSAIASDPYETARKALLPPYNADIMIPSKVYNIRKLIGSYTWSSLGKYSDKLRAECEEEETTLSEALLSKNKFPDSLSKLLKAHGETLNPQKLNVLLFLRHCWSFHESLRAKGKFGNKLKGDLETISKLTFVPFSSIEVILSLFAAQDPSDQSSYVITKTLKDKRILFMMIMYIYVYSTSTNMEADISSFASDLGMEMKTAVKLIREAGFQVHGSSMAHLKVPLTFPQPKRRRST